MAERLLKYNMLPVAIKTRLQEIQAVRRLNCLGKISHVSYASFPVNKDYHLNIQINQETELHYL